jgi:hypothetical protein
VSIRLAIALLFATACLTAAAQTTDSLIDAARRNDFVAFEGLFAREPSPSRAARNLHDVWTHAVTDPAGAFFGGDMYNELVTAHPRFAAYIQEFAVDDRNGDRFYPTAETKKFLIEEMASGESPPSPVQEPVERPVSSPAVTGPDKDRSAQDDALATDMAKLGDFPAPPRRIAPVAAAQMMDPTENARGIFFIIIGLIAAGVAIMTLRTPDERTH